MVSFWKSTNALRGRARREWTAHTGAESVVAFLVRRRGGDDPNVPKAGRKGRLAAGLRALADAGVEAVRAAARARRGLRLHRRAGEEAAPGLVEAGPPPGLRVKVEVRVPTP